MPALLLQTSHDEKPSYEHATVEPFPGFRVAPWFGLRIEGETNVAFEPEIEAAFDSERLRYVPTYVGVRAGEVNGTMLRTVRVTDYLRMGARLCIYVTPEVDGDDDADREPLAVLFDYHGDEPIFGDLFPRHALSAGPTEWALQHVAFSYVFALLSADPPAKAVQRDLGLSPSTADNWIARAKALGLLTPSSEGANPVPQIEAWRRVMRPFTGMTGDE